MIANYKNQLSTIANWLMIGLIVLLWVKFSLSDGTNESFDRRSEMTQLTDIQNKQNTTSIESYHIFGSAKQLYDIPLSRGETSLTFILNGTMSHVDTQTGLAFISNAQGIQQKYKVGDKVFEQATLKEIHKTFVVLNYNGRNERLSLPEKIQVQTSRKNNKAKHEKSRADLSKHLGGQKDWQTLMDEQKFDASKIANIAGNINLVVDQAGVIEGIRVSNLAQGNLLAKHGLKSNDIITAINGNKVTGANMMTIQKTLENNPNATVTIKRNGKLQNININVNNL